MDKMQAESEVYIMPLIGPRRFQIPGSVAFRGNLGQIDDVKKCLIPGDNPAGMILDLRRIAQKNDTHLAIVS